MNQGKVAAQAGHAYVGAFVRSIPQIQAEYHKEFPKSPGTKICLKVNTLGELLWAEQQAKDAGIPYFRVVDSGCANFFDGKPTVTALGLGPATKSQVQQITGRLKLM